MNGFIYIIRNTINNKVYIGQTKVSVNTRWQEHLRHAKYGDQIINRAMRKYGIDKFYVETLEICNIDVIDYIDLYDSANKSKGYNVSIGGKTPKFNMNYTTFRKACIYNNIEYNSSTSAQHTGKYENVC